MVMNTIAILILEIETNTIKKANHNCTKEKEIYYYICCINWNRKSLFLIIYC